MPLRKCLTCMAASAAMLFTAPAFCGLLTESDKQMHVAASAGLGYLVNEMVGDQQYGAAKAFGMAMLPGVAKEIFDSRSGGSGFSSRDLAADALGAALGVSLGKGVHLMLQRHPDDRRGLFLRLSAPLN